MKVVTVVMLILGLCMVVSCVETIEELAIKYEGPMPQTPESVLEAFENVSIKSMPETDEEYPITEWLQTIINKGMVIENLDDYDQYINLRGYLIRNKREYLVNPEKWLTKMSKMKYTFYYNDWETFEDAYIDMKIWKYQQIKEAKQKDPKVYTVVFVGLDNRTVLPLYKKSVVINLSHGGFGYSTQNPNLTPEDVFDIVYKGKHMWGWQVVYLDDMNNILPEKPPLMSREDHDLPPNVPWPPKNQEHLERIIEEVKQDRYKNTGDNR